MSPIDSTPEILLWKHLNKSVDEKWTNWAYEMLEVGFETEHLVELAGIVKPYYHNQFELQALATKVFEELNLDHTNREKIYKDYVDYLVKQVLEKKRDILDTLRILKELYLKFEENDLCEFAMLYWAKEDLNFDEVQHYWPSGDRSNMDEIVLKYFLDWKEKHNGLVD